MEANDFDENLTSTVIVCGLSYNITTAHIDEIFSNFGRIEDLELGCVKGHSSGKALVRYCTHGSALNAVSQMDHGNIDGNEISVKLADPRKPTSKY